MDNFALWVNAPLKALVVTPMEDESIVFIRDEIQQIQQLVNEKLDEQMADEMEKDEKLEKEKVHANNLKSAIVAQSQRSEATKIRLNKLQESCRANEMKLASMKKNFPVCEQTTENYDQMIKEINRPISQYFCNLAFRSECLKKIQTNTDKGIQAAVQKSEIKKLRDSIVDAKKKFEHLTDLQELIRAKKTVAQQEDASRKKQKEIVGVERASLADEKKLLDALKEESIELRAQLVRIESDDTVQCGDPDSVDIEPLLEQVEMARKETARVLSELQSVETASSLKMGEIRIDQDSKAYSEVLETENKNLKALILRKFEEAIEAVQRERVFREIHSLKLAIEEEEKDLELAKDELNELTPTNVESISELQKEVKAMEQSTRAHEKLIREAVVKNDKLFEKVAALIPPTPDACMDDTLDLESEQAPQDTFETPRPALEIKETPPRKHSTDVFTGVPLMTSTPVQKANNRMSPEVPTPTDSQVNRRTRAAARRLAENATTKTSKIGVKKAKR